MTAHAQRLPLAALGLGILGLLPFFGLALQVAAGWPLNPRMTGPALYGLLIYGGVIVSFLGGVHWGLALTDATAATAWRRYAAAVLPSLGASAAVFAGGRSGLIGLAALLAILLLYEHWSCRRNETPPDYLRLRNLLTAGAVTSLLGAAIWGPFA